MFLSMLSSFLPRKKQGFSTLPCFFFLLAFSWFFLLIFGLAAFWFGQRFVRVLRVCSEVFSFHFYSEYLVELKGEEFRKNSSAILHIFDYDYRSSL
jgi:hypothetical protein